MFIFGHTFVIPTNYNNLTPIHQNDVNCLLSFAACAISYPTNGQDTANLSMFTLNCTWPAVLTLYSCIPLLDVGQFIA